MEKPEWQVDYEHVTQHGSIPREGYFKIRFKRGADWVPARIYRRMPIDPDTGEVMERSWMLTGEINGEIDDFRLVWAWGREIEKDEYEWLIAITALRTA